MRHRIETLTDKSLAEFRVLCQLESGRFACFDLPRNENMLIAELGEIYSYMKNRGEKTKAVFIPIQVFLTKAVHGVSELYGSSFKPEFIQDLGIFTGVNIVLYNPSSMGMFVDL